MNQPRTTPVFAMLLAVAAVLLVVLPFVSTFDDLLTTIGMRLGIATPLQWIVPGEVRVTVFMLGLSGFTRVRRGISSSSGIRAALHKPCSSPGTAWAGRA
jgi:hypothetical protein